ncbi:hypothetical protein BDM02DRAFT_3188147 [Thelephora ganbajun]|uniref:Uncharacterized protein n=1 Tax=Thelephora ganbajun TaxID=370292 RepID=A0ACB6ZBT6_THEGA|nr:hypothetical protein BDM02DRAFT_3188147 [Thelephora ganbajun]
MASTLNPGYRKMLDTPVPLEGPRKEAIDSLQKQIDFHIGEANRLRYAQNSHVAISQLPAELLSGVFLYVVEDGLRDQGAGTAFASGTFNFLQVCRHWNEVGVGSPQLWVWWVPDAVKVWHLFKSRSQDSPLFLTWGPHLPYWARDALVNAEIPRSIRQLNFSGNGHALEHLLGVFDSRSFSITSSVRLCGHSYEDNGEHLTRFFSSPFPNLSKLDIENFIPDSSSPIFTASNLTSLKLNFPYTTPHRYTRSQFLQILQQNLSLRELDLRHGAIPLVKQSGALAPVVLSQLVNLNLHGTNATVAGVMDLVSMSSPLHNVILSFQHDHTTSATVLVNTTKKLLTAYYGCKELEHPRKVHCLNISSSPLQDDLVIEAESRFVSSSHPIYNLKLQHDRIGVPLTQKIIPLFPLKRVRELTARMLDPTADNWCGTLRKMKGLSHLRLDSLDIEPVLSALYFFDEVEPGQRIVPNLKSLSFKNVSIFFALQQTLLRLLEERRDHNIGLEKLVIQSCRVTTSKYKAELRGLVKKVTWQSVVEMGSDYDETETEEEIDSDEFYGYEYWSDY